MCTPDLFPKNELQWLIRCFRDGLQMTRGVLTGPPERPCYDSTHPRHFPLMQGKPKRRALKPTGAEVTVFNGTPGEGPLSFSRLAASRR